MCVLDNKMNQIRSYFIINYIILCTVKNKNKPNYNKKLLNNLIKCDHSSKSKTNTYKYIKKKKQMKTYFLTYYGHLFEQ